jgi:hypothetical protein
LSSGLPPSKTWIWMPRCTPIERCSSLQSCYVDGSKNLDTTNTSSSLLSFSSFV